MYPHVLNGQETSYNDMMMNHYMGPWTWKIVITNFNFEKLLSEFALVAGNTVIFLTSGEKIFATRF